jgi:hypothetical protein
MTKQRIFPGGKVLIDICKDGVVTYRTSPRQKRRLNAALPFYQVWSEEHARQLIVLHCKKQYNGDYRIWDFKGEIEDIERVANMFAEHDTGWNGLKGGPLA